jgi:glycosyltransferase involved in cell wall biosynthesis
MKVAHLTSVHPRHDTRIFLKMCSSLSGQGHEVALIVADGLGDESKAGVKIIDVGRASGNRLKRILASSKKVLEQAIKLDAEIYHAHDPELLPACIKLKRMGKTVIFDAHEDFPKQLLAKPYLNWFSQRILSFAATVYERFACKQLDAIITATPSIRIKFVGINSNSVVINNYPILGELDSKERVIGESSRTVVYVGGISRVRGIYPLIDSLSETNDVRLDLIGNFSEEEVGGAARNHANWDKVNHHGFLGREEVASYLSTSIAGMVTFLESPNHIESQPNKMFEYMSAGLPVISSKFPLWREIIEGNDCGICVDPEEPKEIAAAINHLASNTAEAERLGRNGKSAVERVYNWGIEEGKLLELYASLVK